MTKTAHMNTDAKDDCIVIEVRFKTRKDHRHAWEAFVAKTIFRFVSLRTPFRAAELLAAAIQYSPGVQGPVQLLKFQEQMWGRSTYFLHFTRTPTRRGQNQTGQNQFPDEEPERRTAASNGLESEDHPDGNPMISAHSKKEKVAPGADKFTPLVVSAAPGVVVRRRAKL